jgi:hypothetical protein
MGKVELEKFIDECLSESNKSDVMQKRLMSSTFSILSPRAQSVHYIALWLMVDHDLPLAALDDDYHRGNSKHAYSRVFAKIIRKYLSNMSIIVEVKLKSIPPRLFMLNFDGWYHTGIHYIGVMASFFDRDGEQHEHFLMIAPLYGEMIDDSELVVQDSEPNNVFCNPEKGNEATVYTSKAHIKTIKRCLENIMARQSKIMLFNSVVTLPRFVSR